MCAFQGDKGRHGEKDWWACTACHPGLTVNCLLLNERYMCPNFQIHVPKWPKDSQKTSQCSQFSQSAKWRPCWEDEREDEENGRHCGDGFLKDFQYSFNFSYWPQFTFRLLTTKILGQVSSKMKLLEGEQEKITSTIGGDKLSGWYFIPRHISR